MKNKFFLIPAMAVSLSLAACAGGVQCPDTEGFERTAGGVMTYPSDACPGHYVAPRTEPQSAAPIFEQRQRK